MKQLLGHTSLETAYVVEDYPYGFRLRTSIRYWIETKKNFGQRFCSCTVNPKNGKLNKPKCGTYSEALVLGLNETSGHVTQAGVSNYSKADTIEFFTNQYQLDEYQAAWCANAIRVKRQYAAKEAELAAKGESTDHFHVMGACVEDNVAAIKAKAQAACDATDAAFAKAGV